jgi:hypothetical protein
MVRDLFPQLPAGYIEGAACLRQIKQLDTAETLLSEAQAIFPDYPATAWEYAKIVEFAGIRLSNHSCTIPACAGRAYPMRACYGIKDCFLPQGSAVVSDNH